LSTPTVKDRVVVAFIVEQELSLRGLRTLSNNGGPFVSTVIVDGREGELGVRRGTSDTVMSQRFPRLGAVGVSSLAVRHPGTAVETVSLADVALYRDQLVMQMRGGR
ncbi:MAG TPA: hypothetical protein VG712_00950, partial [Gemmatimonadales bacterium]|nr:hypothetical protein [Gemmatimonadales bacterium]